MKADTYNLAVKRTMNNNPKVSDHKLSAINYALGLSGEVGEVVELIKKWSFHGKSLDIEALDKELGDVLWYLTALASETGGTLNSVMKKNIDKLLKRYPNGFNLDSVDNNRDGGTTQDITTQEHHEMDLT